MGSANCSKRKTSALQTFLKGKKLTFVIEISPDSDLEKRKSSCEWFFEQLKIEKCQYSSTYKMLHRKNGEFYVYIINGLNKKIIFSSSDSHRDAVNGNLISRKNYLNVIENIVRFLNINIDI